MTDEKKLVCRICGCELAVNVAVSCSKCKVPFHPECWEYNEGCGIYGCGSNTNEQYVLPEGGAVVAIDEESRPAFSPWPYVERLARSLPRWGQVHGTAAVLGAIGPLFVVLLAALLTFVEKGWSGGAYFLERLFTRVIFDGHAWAIFSVGPVSGLICSLLEPYEREHGFKLAAINLSLSSAAFWFREDIRSVLGYHTGLAVGAITFLMFAIIGCSNLASRIYQRHGNTLKRAMGTVVLLAAFFITLTVAKRGYLRSLNELKEILVFSTFGLAAIAPQLVFTKSALCHRLKAEEAERQEEDSSS